MKKYDYLIVGSGLFGATFAYRACQAGKKCLVIDKRPQLGGNVYCQNMAGIHVHQYGAHIFHTSNREVWDFVNRIVPFNRYTNSPVARYNGKLYNLPFNMNTFYQMWGVTTPEEAQAKLDEQRAEVLANMQAEGIAEPRNLEEQALTLIGKDVYERLIKGYTEKQWGRKCTDLPAFIIKRLPVRMVFDNNYFNDSYQGIPIGGYNKLTAGLLKGVDTLTNCDFFDFKETIRHEGEYYHCLLPNRTTVDSCDCDGYTEERSARAIPKVDSGNIYTEECLFGKLVFTGQIDEYFDYKFGQLNYRTVRFETEVKDTANYQGNAVVNYTEAKVPYTRIIEHKHFEMFGQQVYDTPKTVISREYSTEWKPGMEPYYPVNDAANNQLAQQYRALAANTKDVIFGGRLAEYRYYDMAPIIEKVLRMDNP